MFSQIQTQFEHLSISKSVLGGTIPLVLSKTKHLAIIVQNKDNQPRGLDGFESYLKEDWDGEGAAAISERTLKNAANFLKILPARLPPVDACPGVDGSIGFEWETSVAYLYLDIKPDERVLYYYKFQGVQKDKAVIPAPFIAKSLYERLRSAFGVLGGEVKFDITHQISTYAGFSTEKLAVKPPKLFLYNISGITDGIRWQHT